MTESTRLDGRWEHETTAAIGGDYLTEDQATALRVFIEHLPWPPLSLVETTPGFAPMPLPAS